MSDNMSIYNSCRAVPQNAQKAIQAGRLKGKTDINPMWRIKKLTEMFGPCGMGWWYVIKDQRVIPSGTDEVSAFVDIDLYYRMNGQVSMPIPGVGGSSFVTKEKNGLYVSDECFKMALTDAISVACKVLGMGADVYWEKDSTKYDQRPEPEMKKTEPIVCAACGEVIGDFIGDSGKRVSSGRIIDASMKKYGVPVCAACGAARAYENAG